MNVDDRVQLILMTKDADPIQAGEQGVITSIVDVGESIIVDVKWDNGRTLNCVLPPDMLNVIGNTPNDCAG